MTENEDIKTQIKKNKDNALGFYKMAFEGNPKLAVQKFVGDEYIRHNPLVKTGKSGFIQYFTRMQEEHPNKSIEFVRAVAEEDLVSVHTHQVWPGDGEYVTMDFFRFDNDGKIIKHWDAVQKVPEPDSHERINNNSMY